VKGLVDGESVVEGFGGDAEDFFLWLWDIGRYC